MLYLRERVDAAVRSSAGGILSAIPKVCESVRFVDVAVAVVDSGRQGDGSEGLRLIPRSECEEKSPAKAARNSWLLLLGLMLLSWWWVLPVVGVDCCAEY